MKNKISRMTESSDESVVLWVTVINNDSPDVALSQSSSSHRFGVEVSVEFIVLRSMR